MDRSPRGATTPSRWIGWRPTPAVATLMAIQALAYAVFVLVLGSPAWINHLALSPERALGREPWQLVTSALVHGDVRGLIMDLIGIWFIGSIVEQQLGPRRMLTVFWLSQVVGAATAAAMGLAFEPLGMMAGSAFGIAGLLAGMTVTCWSMPLSVFGTPPVRGRWVALLLVGLTVLQVLWASQWVWLGGTLAALGAASIYLSVVRVARVRRATHWKKSLTQDLERVRMWRLRRRYRVIPGGRDEAHT